ncbi:MAG: hypothetical protein RMI79_04375 [Nitrososphaerota archaeon]|nr:hypothetical protein [Nitrososphaerota archaeon]
MDGDDPGRSMRVKKSNIDFLIEKYIYCSFIAEIDEENREDGYKRLVDVDPRSVGAIENESSYIKIYKAGDG